MLAKLGYGYAEGKILAASVTARLDDAKAHAEAFDLAHLGEHIRRIEGAVDADPALAIGSAKELVETTAKTILESRGISYGKSDDLPRLAKATFAVLRQLPDGVSDAAKGAEIIKRTLSNLASVVQGLAEIRSLYGTGHGRAGATRGVSPRHARLAVGAAATLATYLLDTHKETPLPRPWKRPVTSAPDHLAESRGPRVGSSPAETEGHPEEENQASAFPNTPVGSGPVAVRLWFDEVAAAAKPDNDGSLTAAHDSARAYRSRAKADNTRAAYRSAVRAWCAWSARHGVAALPATPRDVAGFLAAERDRGQAGNTIKLRAAAIRFLHRAAGLPSPTDTAEVSETMAGIRRDAPNPQKKRAATLTVLRELLAPIPDDLRGLRDRALLLVGFAGALRRSELAGIELGDLLRTDQGYELTLKRSKGSQTAAVLVPLPYGKTELCPVRALTRWLDAAAISEGAIFRRIWAPPQSSPDAPPAPLVIGSDALTTRSIGRIVQQRAVAAGFAGREFGGHSLKRGALSAGMAAGAHAAQLKRLGRHKSFDVLGEYLEFGNLFDDHPLGGVL